MDEGKIYIKDIIQQNDGRMAAVVSINDIEKHIRDLSVCTVGEFVRMKQENVLCLYFVTMKEPE